MKRALCIGCFGIFCLSSPGQEKPKPEGSAPRPSRPAEVVVEAPRAAKAATLSTNVMDSLTEKPKEPREPAIKFGGLGTEFKRSTNRWKMFSLRIPRDPKRDGENVVRTLRTEGGGGVKLWSVDF